MIYVGWQCLDTEVIRAYEYLGRMRELVEKSGASAWFKPDQAERVLRDYDSLWEQIYRSVQGHLEGAGFSRKRGDRFVFSFVTEGPGMHYGYERGEIESGKGSGF